MGPTVRIRFPPPLADPKENLAGGVAGGAPTGFLLARLEELWIAPWRSKESTAMAITKVMADATKGRPSRRDRAKIEATTEDGHSPPDDRGRRKPGRRGVRKRHHFPWYIRKRLGMPQREFANTLGVSIGTLRNWEQNRVAMEPATIALMRILAREPEAALRALRRRAA
jgi:putative transcriptional regulator